MAKGRRRLQTGYSLLAGSDSTRVRSNGKKARTKRSEGGKATWLGSQDATVRGASVSDWASVSDKSACDTGRLLMRDDVARVLFMRNYPDFYHFSLFTFSRKLNFSLKMSYIYTKI